MLIFSAQQVMSQSETDWERMFHELGDTEDDESSSWESTYDVLSELSEHPLNINTCTREDLQRIPFLNDNQIADICEYIYKYGAMKTTDELLLLPSMDFNHAKLLSCFVYAGDTGLKGFPSLQQILKGGRHQVILTAKLPCYNRRGDDNGYLGYKYKHSFRYSFQYSENVKVGLVGSQDSGEPFFSNKNSKGYDYYSFYAVLRKLGRLKTLAVGRYRVSFGMGLVINNDFGLGKIATMQTLGRSHNAIRGHYSLMEANYLQGAAATVGLTKGLDVSAFVSYRYIDATLNDDEKTIATILTTGYHRTESEMKRKHNATSTLAGGNINYRYNGFHIGATATYTSFSKDLQPKKSQKYREYYPTGNDFYNIGVDYGYTSKRFTFNGETATGDSHAIATINNFSYLLTPSITLMALQRFYSYKYTSLYAESFSEGGAVQNESGVYIGVSWRPSRNLSLMAYTDYCYFAWPKYQAAQASKAWDNLLSATYTKGRFSFIARYRVKIREKDNDKKTALINQTTHRGRLGMSYDGGRWSLGTQADAAYSEWKDNSFGWMISEFAGYSMMEKKININASFGYFNTQSYDSRLYIYERGMLYSFNFPMFYGKGIRYTLYAKAQIMKQLMLICKVSTTDYFDRDHISSSLQQIDHSSMTDVELQLKWKF
jgi:hypothetical protein